MMRKVLKVVLGGVAAVVLLVAGFVGYSYAHFAAKRSALHDVAPLEMADAMNAADAKLGERIVRVRNACSDCHGADLGGRVIVDNPAIGRLVAPNITPYRLKHWTDGEIARAIHEGVGKDRRALLIMPSEEYHHFGKSDLAAVIAYLRTVPEVAADKEDSTPGPLAYALYALGKLPNLFPRERIPVGGPAFAEKPAEAPTHEFGRYLVSTACSGCHGESLAGGPIPGAPPEWAPAADLRPAAIGAWSQEDFARALRTGVNPSGRAIRPPMPISFTKNLSDVELTAIWKYLQKPDARGEVAAR